MADPTTLVLQRLRAAGHDPKQTRTGWSCRCPAHDDRGPSLSIGKGDDGRVLLTCHAGCPFDSIVAALGLEKRDTFAENGQTRHRPPAAAKPTTTFSTWEAAVRSIAGRRGQPAGTWHYHDADGTHVGTVVRWPKPGGGKDVRPVARQADGTWVAAGMATPRPLYGLPAVIEATGVVYVTEGEKAADAVRTLGLTCTTSAHGAQSAGGTDWSPLAGHDVVVLPDHDDPGESYATDVVRLATAAGAVSVRVVRLVDVWPAMPVGGDAFDWIEAHDATDADDLRAVLERLVAAIGRLAAGEAVVVSQRKGSADWPLIRWAKREGVFVNVDRKTRWGNPHELANAEDNAERDRVCDTYAAHVAARPDLLADVGSLAGRVLGCWCAPRRCHADELARLAAEARPAAPLVPVTEADDDHDALDWRPFPVELLPDPVRSFVVEQSTSIGCDPSFLALPMLAYAAGAIGTTRSCVVKPGWEEPTVVWAAIVGDPGSQKTPAFKAAGQFADARQRDAFAEHAERMLEHDRAMLEHDANVAAWKRDVAKGRGGAPPDKPVRPAATRYVVSDTTIEALAPILADNPRGLTVAVDELAGWMESFGQYKSGGRGADAAKWLSMHNAGAVTVDRKGGATLYVPQAAVSVVGGIQRRVLARTIGQQYRENGLLARILLAMPPRRPKTWSVGGAWSTTTTDVASVFAVLYSLEAGPAVDLDADATDVFKQFFAEHAAEQAAATGDVAAMLAKIEAYAARLSLIVHLLGWAGRQHDRQRIGAADVEAGVALARWFAREARRVYHGLEHGDDDSADAVDELVAWIGARGGSASVRDVARGLRRYRGTVAAEAGLRRLVAAGLATWESTSTGGRPTDAVRLVATEVAKHGRSRTFGTVATGAVPKTEVA